ncbi:MAG: excisionase [Eubacteriaceae bacterium]|nr:excisionase [Eubacteriaceae bacterium]
MEYTLMHQSLPVLDIVLDEETGTVTSINKLHSPEHLPIGVPLAGNAVGRRELNAWWIGRSIPASRSGIREALEAMNVRLPQLLLSKSFGLSLSDQYWACPKGSSLQWEDINFFDHPFSDDVGNILFGNSLGKHAISLISPDNTSDGWLQKKWVIANDKRFLVKGGSGAQRQEPYNEALASAIMRRLGISHIPYALTIIDEYPYSVCEDFITRETELVTAWYIIQTQKKPNHVSLYEHYINCCDALGIPGISSSLDEMMALDYIIANEDRHMGNFGAVRNAGTLEWIGPAPIFDSGTSMHCNDPTPMIQTNRKSPSKPFRKYHIEQIELVRSFEWLDIKALNGIEEEYRDMLSGSAFIDKERTNALCYSLLKRIQQLSEYIQNKRLL